MKNTYLWKHNCIANVYINSFIIFGSSRLTDVDGDGLRVLNDVLNPGPIFLLDGLVGRVLLDEQPLDDSILQKLERLKSLFLVGSMYTCIKISFY